MVSRRSCAVAVARLAVPKRDEPSNKGMKQTSVERTGRSQLVSRVFDRHVEARGHAGEAGRALGCERDLHEATARRCATG